MEAKSPFNLDYSHAWRLAAGLFSFPNFFYMSNKQSAIDTCKEYLTQLSIAQYFNLADFNYYYRKNGGAGGHPYYIGLSAADYIIKSVPPEEIARPKI